MESVGDLYRIGTVANLTGVAVERLRAWERRHGFAPAHRDGRTRFYSGEQLQRLRRIKHLIDQGHPISSLAGLSEEQLQARMQPFGVASKLPPRVGLIGLDVVRLAQRQQEGAALEVAASWLNMEEFTAVADAAPALDALVLGVPVLSMQPIEYIKRNFPRTRIVVVYQYAAEKYLRRVADLGAAVFAWPVRWPDIERACSAAPQAAGGLAKRRFADAELAAIATAGKDPNGCLEHLVELICKLNAFADYMHSCSAADEATAETAALHRRAQEEASQARARLEAALEAFCEPSPSP